MMVNHFASSSGKMLVLLNGHNFYAHIDLIRSPIRGQRIFPVGNTVC